MTRHRIVEPSEEAVDGVDPVVRIYKESCEAAAGPQSFRGPCGFQGSYDRGPDCTGRRKETIPSNPTRKLYRVTFAPNQNGNSFHGRPWRSRSEMRSMPKGSTVK